MSFILDALNKSETERQRQRDPAAVVVPTALPKKPTPIVFWVLGAILLANTAVILYVMWPDSPASTDAVVFEQPAVSTPPQTVPLPAAAITEGSVRTLSGEVAANTSSTTTLSEPVATLREQQAASSSSQAATRTRPLGGNIPSLAELVLDGSLEPMNLHVDVHVYHAERRSRFVVLNSRRYREGDRISEGPVLESITPDGAVLAHNGRRFSITNDR